MVLLPGLLLALAAGPAVAWTQDAGEEVERLSSTAEAELQELSDELARGADPARWAAHFSARFHGSLPTEESLSTSRHGVYRVRRLVSSLVPGPDTSDPVVALRAWLSGLLQLEGRRVAFKIIAVHSITNDRFTTEVLLEASGRRGDQISQWNARWVLQWVQEDQHGGPRIQDLSVLRHTQVTGPGPLFVEVGGALLDLASGSTAVLAYGCEDWVRRIDRVGEPNWFGHNGLALGDVNGDGLEDLYVATGTGVPNLLFVRRADGTLEECAHEAGVAWLDDTKGVLLVDMDGDGDRDLLCAMGPAILLSLNDGEGHFTPANSLRAGTDAAFYSLAAGDYDLDGDLDIYAVRYVKTSYTDSIPIPFQDARNGPRNHLLRNDGGSFVDVTDEVGLGAGNDRFSLSATWVDYDDDGDPDLYVTNDFGRNNLYRNDSGHFVDVAAASGTEDQAAGMGAHWGDPDRDGDLDLLVSNMFSSAGQRVAYQPQFRAGQPWSVVEGVRRHAQGNSLFLNQGDGTFLERGEPAGLRMGRWSWGARFVDFNCDGLEDVVVPNGFVTGERADDL